MTQDVHALGRVAVSKAGRDKGRVFLVVGVLDDNHVLLSDGRTHKVDNPKKKKLMHICFGELISEEISVKLSNGVKLSDAEVRKALVDLGYHGDKE